MKISENVKYVGVNDYDIDLFEGQYIVPNGMAYNSYVILDEKIAVMDSVDGKFTKEWLANIKDVLGDKAPDYLIVQHMEPDHSANIANFVKEFPDSKIVSTALSFKMMKGFFDNDFKEKQLVIGDGDTLSLGKSTLSFFTAPMVHWPEVIVTYYDNDKILFSADGFGKFGTTDTDEEWLCEARRYYIGIVGKYGAQVQDLLKKASGLDIETICPLHGPVLDVNLDYYISYYDKWSRYEPEEEGVYIACSSVYGNTKKAAEYLAEKLREKGCKNVVVDDLTRCDMAEAFENAFRYSKIVLASVTYNAGIFPAMRRFITGLTERNFQNRLIGIIENGSWAPLAAGIMKGMFDKSRDIRFTDTTVKILSAMNEASRAQLDELAEELCK